MFYNIPVLGDWARLYSTVALPGVAPPPAPKLQLISDWRLLMERKVKIRMEEKGEGGGDGVGGERGDEVQEMLLAV